MQTTLEELPQKIQDKMKEVLHDRDIGSGTTSMEVVRQLVSEETEETVRVALAEFAKFKGTTVAVGASTTPDLASETRQPSGGVWMWAHDPPGK